MRPLAAHAQWVFLLGSRGQLRRCLVQAIGKPAAQDRGNRESNHRRTDAADPQKTRPKFMQAFDLKGPSKYFHVQNANRTDTAVPKSAVKGSRCGSANYILSDTKTGQCHRYNE